MDFIEWRDSYSVGIAEMDAQHQRIIHAINKLDKESRSAVNSELVSDILTELTAYASQHFQAEEELLQRIGFPDFDEHQQEHKAYRLKVVALCQDTIAQSHLVPTSLLAFLKDWWVAHILESDQKYAGFAASQLNR